MVSLRDDFNFVCSADTLIVNYQLSIVNLYLRRKLSMLALGCHLSISKGYAETVRTAHSIGANTFAFFTRNPRGSQARPEDPADAAAAVKLMEELNFAPLVAHGAYTMNLCTAEASARALPHPFLRTIFAEWQRCPAISIISTPAATLVKAQIQASPKSWTP